ncbi:histidine kinase [Clostridia bacterium]|nr:histidine kinase [Clostridia bacterium]
MFKKLRNSIMLFNVLIVSLVMIAAFSVIYLATHRNIERENQQRLQAVSAMFFSPNRSFSFGFRPPDNVSDSSAETSAMSERFSVEYGVSFVLFVKDGQLINVNSQLDLDDSVYIEAFQEAGGLQNGQITLANRKWIFAIAETPSTSGRFSDIPDGKNYSRIVFLDITNGSNILRTLMITLVPVGLGVLFVLFWVSYRFAVRAVRPIEENYNRQKQFIADASHELRTPLAVISANVDAVTASGDETVDSQKEWFDYIRTELKRTGKLVDDLLYLAKSENIRSESSLPFNLSAACETVCASMEAVLYDGGKSLKTDIAENVTVVADSEKLAGVLYILLDNAGKYTPEDGHISVTLTRESDKAVLRVMNSGEGIAKPDLPKIFDRFYRTDASRSTETGGSGLGLSIAKTIIENSGGTITAESVNGATTFTIKLRAQKG